MAKNLAVWFLGIAGGAWAIGAGDPLGVALSVAGMGVEALPDTAPVASAYSYVFEVGRQLGRAW